MSTSSFSSPRFKRLIKAYFTENGRMINRAIIAFLILSLSTWLILISILIANDADFAMGLQIFLFVINGFIFPILASGWFYGRLNSTERQISFLVVPATHLEKHLLSTIMGFLLPIALGILSYYIGEIISIALHNKLAQPFREFGQYHSEFYGVPLFKIILDSDYTTLICISYAGFLGFGMAFLQFFTLHFTRFALFKILLLLLALTLIISVYIYLTLETMDISDNALFAYTRYLAKGWSPNGRGYETEILLFVVPCLLSAVVLWVASYIRLKEYQIK